MKKIFGLSAMSFFIISTLQIHAQNFYNKSGTVVSISQAGILSVMDSLINEGTLINNGNMAVGGTWLNLGTYDAGEGQITFNSTNPNVPQIINHNNQTFSKLVISGGGQKLILADLTVEESLTLTDGIITAQNNHGVHFSPAAGITGGSDASHINAAVYHQGTGTKLFPVGNGTNYLPVEINNISANSQIGITLTELQAGQTLNTNSSLDDISTNHYWAIEVTSGSLEGAHIVLPVQGDEGLDASKNDRFVVAFAAAIDDDFLSIGRASNSTNLRVTSQQSPANGFVALAIPSENRSIVVYNAISPDGTAGENDYLQIDNLVETDVVSIYNRWGDLVFEMKNYQNDSMEKRFNGLSNRGGSKDLPTGTYFYLIKRKAGEAVSGYISLRR